MNGTGGADSTGAGANGANGASAGASAGANGTDGAGGLHLPLCHFIAGADGAGAGADSVDNSNSAGTESKKRKKMTHVFVSCYDYPDDLIEIDTTLLKDFGCRLALLIKHTKPEVVNCREVWRCGLARNMLLTIIKSLTLGELILCDGIGVSEAIATFEFEGIFVRSSRTSHSITPRNGIAFPKPTFGNTLQKVCGDIADAIIQWPRLETLMQSPLSYKKCGKDDSRLTVSSTCAWIQFSSCPHTDDQELINLACRSPRWFKKTICCIGSYRHMLFKGTELENSYSRESFNTLIDSICDDMLGQYAMTRFDFCKDSARGDYKRALSVGHDFYLLVCRNVMKPNDVKGDAYNYACGIATFAENTIHESNDLDKLFSSKCCDEHGKSYERRILADALERRGVKLVRWNDDENVSVRPVVFPTHFKQPRGQNNGPIALLSFENVIAAV